MLGGALAGGAAGVAESVNDANAAKQQLKEAQSHEKTIEAITLERESQLKSYKKGLGLHMKPYRPGEGLRLKPVLKNLK